ncbi:MAG: LytR/AlgR family response regulator transcription factor [Saprospiraceae bacterium]
MSTQAIRILIVEDELPFQLDLEMMLDEMEYDVIGIVDNSEEAIKTIFVQKPDLILMDIDINGDLSGIEVGEKIKELEIPIIYITSHNNREMYESAKTSNLAGYMVKPVNRITFESTLDVIALQIIKDRQNKNFQENKGVNINTQNKILIKHNKFYHMVKLDDIQFVEASEGYTTIHLAEKSLVSNLRLSDLEQLLPKEKFVKTHRSYIMNIQFCDAIDASDHIILMKNGKQIPISRAMKKKIMEIMNLG